MDVTLEKIKHFYCSVVEVAFGKVARLLDADSIDGASDAVPKPMGSILAPEARIFEEEITRGGRAVGRRYQSTSWINGATYVWSGRRVRPGKGEVYSGLKYDFIVETDTFSE